MMSPVKKIDTWFSLSKLRIWMRFELKVEIISCADLGCGENRKGRDTTTKKITTIIASSFFDIIQYNKKRTQLIPISFFNGAFGQSEKSGWVHRMRHLS